MNALSQPESDRTHPGEALDFAERMLLAYSIGFAAMQKHVRTLQAEFALFEDPLERSYWLSRTEFLLGWLAGSAGNRRSAVLHYRRAVDLSVETLRMREFSDTYRVFADATGQLLTHRGILYQLSHGIRARDAALRAVELDWNNLRAHISLGAWYTNAPELAGGNPRYAVEILERVILHPEARDSEHFLAHAFRALASEEVEDHDGARESYFAARSLFPGNPLLPRIAAELELHEQV